jgi:(3,5-dihydroxyphenyl)acetyl-CoA 1,2-dioxygenase
MPFSKPARRCGAISNGTSRHSRHTGAPAPICARCCPLPARKEGIIPGAANMRLPRFTGDRIARQAIMYDRRLECDSAEGRLICDEVAPPADMDHALARVIEGMTSSGVVSAVGNRRCLRAVQEPLDMFLGYLAVYAREQAYCHFSPALIANLERHWDARNRRP